eukprot:TRINITY_DN1507_c0_g1_i1.p1 TRINITY_DN1507_c0_g1~~TRINITY_DN1507_c0_g1_i1.p1  ORF type:complete len:148 (-),score=22.40 TRINITY_DN1507_c0_g1_i1:58-501(-)
MVGWRLCCRDRDETCWEDGIICTSCVAKPGCIWCGAATVPGCLSGDMFGAQNTTLCPSNDWYWATCSIAGDSLFESQQTYLLIIIISVFILLVLVFIVYCIVSSVHLGNQEKKIKKKASKPPTAAKTKKASSSESEISLTSTYSSLE